MKPKLAVLALLLLSSSAFAESAGDNYLGGQLAALNYKETGFEALHPTAAVLRLGHYLDRNFSIEGRLGVGLGKDSTHVYYAGMPFTVSVELDNLFGVYGVGHLPINDLFSIYGLVGWANVNLTANAGNYYGSASASDSGSGLSFGAGVEFNLSRETSLNFEYTSYYHDADVDLTALSVGMSLKF